ncbi:MAG: helix-turn-helix transcriptional regulator [Firmicutes bacterium]|nr:helix-turn-helix transcriptional regulator [Bacillota bacterium]
MTQAELAARLGITQQTLSKHETGARTPCHFSVIRGYERELKTPARALFPDIFID